MPNAPPQHRAPLSTLPRQQAPRQESKARSIRDGARWQRLRGMKLSRDPLCECGECPAPTPATQVHHIYPIATHTHLAHTWFNLLSVATACHARIEARLRAGVEPMKAINR